LDLMVSMLRLTIAFVFVASVTANAQLMTTRIDASTSDSAQASWNQMLAEADNGRKAKLEAALDRIIEATGKEEGWGSLRFHVALEAPNASIIKDKIAGLSAQQIIELASRTAVAK
jgi:hypothetical protein